jgi:hypothetical protein
MDTDGPGSDKAEFRNQKPECRTEEAERSVHRFRRLHRFGVRTPRTGNNQPRMNTDGHRLNPDPNPSLASPGAASTPVSRYVAASGQRQRRETTSRKRRSCTLVVQMIQSIALLVPTQTSHPPSPSARLSVSISGLLSPFRGIHVGFRSRTLSSLCLGVLVVNSGFGHRGGRTRPSGCGPRD